MLMHVQVANTQPREIFSPYITRLTTWDECIPLSPIQVFPFVLLLWYWMSFNNLFSEILEQDYQQLRKKVWVVYQLLCLGIFVKSKWIVITSFVSTWIFELYVNSLSFQYVHIFSSHTMNFAWIFPSLACTLIDWDYDWNRSDTSGYSDDKLHNIHEKLDVVRTTMQENIQQILLNQESVDKINSSAEHLTEQSIAFKSSTKELRNRMFWKMIKMRLLIFSVICALTAIIVVPIYFYSKK